MTGLMRGKRVVIAGVGNRLAVFLMRFVPNALLLAAVDRRVGMRRRPMTRSYGLHVCFPWTTRIKTLEKRIRIAGSCNSRS